MGSSGDAWLRREELVEGTGPHSAAHSTRPSWSVECETGKRSGGGRMSMMGESKIGVSGMSSSSSRHFGEVM